MSNWSIAMRSGATTRANDLYAAQWPAYRRAGMRAGRILKGDKPSNFPIHQATE
jgi:hypothetical protein